SKYSFLDAEVTGKLGARWKPTKDLIVRGSYSRGFRAPSIGELYGAKSRFDATISDPCSAVMGMVPAAVRDRCTSPAIGVPANGTYEQPNAQISVITNGNRDLKPEKSNSFNISAAFSPAALQDQPSIANLDFEAAYWDI